MGFASWQQFIPFGLMYCSRKIPEALAKEYL